ncbi:MAG TPA: twin-arginine translocase TatA/TatE family subunit [Acidimicrobiales bacterium]
MLANIIGPDLLIVLGVVVLLFGGSQLPKLARSLGSARREFEQGVSGPDEQTTEAKPPPARSA